MAIPTNALEKIKEYYGKVVTSKKDLKTNACCSTEALPSYLREIATELHPEVKDRFYGCGSPIPPAIEGKTVLDLGCGAGRDAYLLSKLVGPEGQVLGVDMTEEQLAVARRHTEYHAKKFSFQKSNVRFLTGYIEDLEAAGIPSQSVDVVISNCVMNLSPDKPRAYAELFRVLKPGGELYFSDVFANRRLPKAWAEDPVLLGECLGGAMYTEDFRRLLLGLQIRDFRVVSKTQIRLDNEEIAAKVGGVDFYSMTVRAFKLDIEDRCEDYGQVAYYLGTIPQHPHNFALDDHHLFRTGLPMLVCSNTAAMVAETRFKPHFKIIGDTTTHYGLFDCAPAAAPGSSSSGVGCC